MSPTPRRPHLQNLSQTESFQRDRMFTGKQRLSCVTSTSDHTNLQLIVNVESRRGIFSYEVDEISDLCAILPRAEKLVFSSSKAEALGSFSIISFSMAFPSSRNPCVVSTDLETATCVHGILQDSFQKRPSLIKLRV